VNKALSIQTKVNLSLVVVFMVVFASSLTAIFRSETALTREVAEFTTLATADSYFDSINMLMLSGAMANRGVLQQKILSNESITEARIIRGDAVSNVYGPGSEDSVIMDELDRRAMQGEQIIRELDDEQGHRLTVLTPMKALSDYKGTNCLLCHQVEEGTVLGAVRVTYDFALIDKQIMVNLRNVALVEMALFIAGILLIGLILRRIVIRPINSLADTMHDIERNSDLSQRIEIKSDDEIGRMSKAFNSMLGNFQSSIQHVNDTVLKLSSSSSQIHSIASRAIEAARGQQMQTSAVASAMEQMEAATKSVEASAESTVSASDLALQESTEGTQVTQTAIEAIEELQASIERATSVIERLDSQSQNVGTVLEVIQKVAEQTNLLALNAAIEAARAGEQGRGFAVVADGVRTLASRTHNSTEEINKIISDLQIDAKDAVGVMRTALEGAGAGVEQVRRTANALSNIAEEVRVINDMNHQVASAVREQTQMASSVEQSITEINSSAETTASWAQELSSVSEHLADLSKQLEQMVSRFKL
jgi:methyl-accepting chemotaxis protein